MYQAPDGTAEAKRQASAVQVFQNSGRWHYAHRRKDGHPYFLIPGTPIRHRDGQVSTPAYYVDLHSCTCGSHMRGRVACKHILAVRLWHAAWKRGEVTAPALGAVPRRRGHVVGPPALGAQRCTPSTEDARVRDAATP